MNTLPDDVREKILAIINSFESEVIRHDDPEYVHRVILNEDYPNLADKIMEEYAKAYAPVPNRKELPIKILQALIYYSQIHTVDGVRPVELPTHNDAWRQAQQWLWDNHNIVDGEYVPKLAAAPVPGKEEIKIPSHNMFMAGGNTQSEKDFYQLGYSAAMQKFNSDAVEFAEWIAIKEYITTTVPHEDVQLWQYNYYDREKDKMIEGPEITTQELYNLFLENKNSIQQAHDKAQYE